MNIKHVIFDLDGTLIDSKNEIENTYRKVFEKITPLEKINYEAINYGETLNSILEDIYKNNKRLIQQAKIEFSILYDNSNFTKTYVYPFVLETIEYLYHQNFVLHIATNKRFIPTINILKAKRIFGYFSAVISSDYVAGKIASKAEMVNKICIEHQIKNGVMVGDNSQDIEAGFASNLITIAALYGYGSKDTLLKTNPTFSINQFQQLNNILVTES